MIALYQSRPRKRTSLSGKHHGFIVTFFHSDILIPSPGIKVHETGCIFNQLSSVKCAQMNKTKAKDMQ